MYSKGPKDNSINYERKMLGLNGTSERLKKTEIC